jgi:hypothetical protein
VAERSSRRFWTIGEIDEFIVSAIPTFIGEGVSLIAPLPGGAAAFTLSQTVSQWCCTASRCREASRSQTCIASRRLIRKNVVYVPARRREQGQLDISKVLSEPLRSSKPITVLVPSGT